MITKFPYGKIDRHSLDCTNHLFEQTTPNYNVAISSMVLSIIIDTTDTGALPQRLCASEINTTRGRTHLLAFFKVFN